MNTSPLYAKNNLGYAPEVMADTTPNFGALYSTATSGYNAMSPTERARLSGFSFGGMDESGNGRWSFTNSSDNLPLNIDANQTGDSYVRQNSGFDNQKFFSDQGISPMDPKWGQRDGLYNGPQSMTKEQARAYQDNFARSFNQFGFNFRGIDDYNLYRTGPGKYVDDPTLGEVWVPDNRNSQTWNQSAMAASGVGHNPVNRALDSGALVYGLGGAVAGAGAFDIFNGGANSIFGGGGFGGSGFDSAGADISDSAGGGAAGPDVGAGDGGAFDMGGSNGYGGTTPINSGSGLSLGDVRTPPLGGGGSTTTAPAGTDANGNLVDANGTPYGPPSSSTAGGTVADSRTIPGAETGGGTGSALSRVLNGTATPQDYLSLAGTIGSTGLGIAGANNQSNQLRDIYNQQRADRAPALTAYNNALSNPNSWYSSAPAQGAADAAARALSIHGNPAGNPGDIAKLSAYNLGGYNSYLNGLEPAAFGGQQTQALLGTNAAQASGGIYNALGSGLAGLTNPPQSGLGQLSQILNLGSRLV